MSTHSLSFDLSASSEEETPQVEALCRQILQLVAGKPLAVVHEALSRASGVVDAAVCNVVEETVQAAVSTAFTGVQDNA